MRGGEGMRCGRERGNEREEVLWVERLCIVYFVLCNNLRAEDMSFVL